MSFAVILQALTVSASASVQASACDSPCPQARIYDDGTYSVTLASGKSRSTPVIDAEIIETMHQDIDGDGVAEYVVIDNRQSAYGSVTAVYYDVSLGEPYMAFQCQASMTENVSSECPNGFAALTADASINGLDTIFSATRGDAPLDWETRHLAIPNWTTTAALTLAVQNVALQRARYQLDPENGDALNILKAALDLRELRALQYHIAD